MSTVFVIDGEGKPLLPTCEARARLLLKKKKARVYSVVPFTIQLTKVIDNPVGEFSIGIDDGGKFIGISIAHEEKIVFAGNIKLRLDVHRKMLQRAQYRSTRRSRIRHREVRFLNRGQLGWIPPTIHQKKESILRVVDDLSKRLNITKCIVEQGQFDISSINKGYKLVGKEYQQAEYEGNNWREKVLWRDKYTCQHCDSKHNLHTHHIKQIINGGTNIVSNGVILCQECHESLHRGEWIWIGKIKNFKYPTHLQQGKWWLFNELKKRIDKVQICYGWMTAMKRKELGLNKDHYHDASAMINANKYHCKPYEILPRRTKKWENHPTRKCIEKKGFKHFDIVKAKHKTRGIIIGSIRSLKAKAITLRTNFDNNFTVSYSKTKLLWRPRGLIYC